MSNYEFTERSPQEHGFAEVFHRDIAPILRFAEELDDTPLKNSTRPLPSNAAT